MDRMQSMRRRAKRLAEVLMVCLRKKRSRDVASERSRAGDERRTRVGRREIAAIRERRGAW